MPRRPALTSPSSWGLSPGCGPSGPGPRLPRPCWACSAYAAVLSRWTRIPEAHAYLCSPPAGPRRATKAGLRRLTRGGRAEAAGEAVAAAGGRAGGGRGTGQEMGLRSSERGRDPGTRRETPTAGPERGGAGLPGQGVEGRVGVTAARGAWHSSLRWGAPWRPRLGLAAEAITGSVWGVLGRPSLWAPEGDTE